MSMMDTCEPSSGTTLWSAAGAGGAPVLPAAPVESTLPSWSAGTPPPGSAGGFEWASGWVDEEPATALTTGHVDGGLLGGSEAETPAPPAPSGPTSAPEDPGAALQEKVSTPIGQGGTWDAKTGSATLSVAGATVIVKPDTIGVITDPEKDAVTQANFDWDIDWTLDKKGGVGLSVPAPKVTVTIQTTYRPGVDAGGPSGIGRGTTPEDQAAGKTTLREHEGSHGQDAMAYLASHPLPVFTGKKGMSEAELNDAAATWQAAMRSYSAQLDADTFIRTDCVGTVHSACPDAATPSAPSGSAPTPAPTPSPIP